LKKNILILSLFFLVGFGKISAQSNLKKAVDSLRHLISNSNDDTLKISRYNALCSKLVSLNQASDLLKITEEGLEISEKISYDKGKIQMTLFKAIAIDIMGQPEKAVILYNKSLKMAQEHKEGELEANCYINLGVSYQYMGDYDLALKYQLLAYDLREELAKKNLAKLLNNIGVIYRLQKKYSRAEDIYLKSYQLKEDYIKYWAGMTISQIAMLQWGMYFWNLTIFLRQKKLLKRLGCI